MALYFSRNTKVYLKQGSNMWEIPVLDGFSFSQGANSSEITLSEGMKYHATERKVRRSRRMFTDSLAPAEWSFSTYARPFQAKVGQSQGWESANGSSPMVATHHAVEEPLWANFVSTNSWTPSTLGDDNTAGGSGGDADANSSWAKTVTNSATNMIIDFEDSETGEVGEFELVFIISDDASGTNKKGYEIKKCVVNEVTLDFDVEGLTTLNWSGFGSDIDDYDTAIPGTVINEEINTTDNFIRNRLTTLNVQAPDGGLFAGGSEGSNPATTGHYDVVLTGGSISFSNNITYLTPETLGRIDTPLGHVTGTRTIGGSFTAYLDSAADKGTAELFDELVNNDSVITNSFNLTFNVGGTTNPKIQIAMPQCHLEIPTHSIEDVISMEVNFHALTSGFTPTSADNFEAKLTYTGIANT